MYVKEQDRGAVTTLSLQHCCKTLRRPIPGQIPLLPVYCPRKDLGRALTDERYLLVPLDIPPGDLSSTLCPILLLNDPCLRRPIPRHRPSSRSQSPRKRHTTNQKKTTHNRSSAKILLASSSLYSPACRLVYLPRASEFPGGKRAVPPCLVKKSAILPFPPTLSVRSWVRDQVSRLVDL